MECPKCGKKNVKKAKFCAGCGDDLVDTGGEEAQRKGDTFDPIVEGEEEGGEAHIGWEGEGEGTDVEEEEDERIGWIGEEGLKQKEMGEGEDIGWGEEEEVEGEEVEEVREVAGGDGESTGEDIGWGEGEGEVEEDSGEDIGWGGEVEEKEEGSEEARGDEEVSGEDIGWGGEVEEEEEGSEEAPGDEEVSEEDMGWGEDEEGRGEDIGWGEDEKGRGEDIGWDEGDGGEEHIDGISVGEEKEITPPPPPESPGRRGTGIGTGLAVREDDEEEAVENMKNENTLDDEKLFLGSTSEGHVQIPLDTLKRHFIALGASGSGKTVFGKCVLEEVTRKGIPSIVIDPQGDLASLALFADEEVCKEHDIPLEVLMEFRAECEVRIFTPASSKGIPLCLTPLKELPDHFSPEEAIRAIDTISGSLVSLLGYKQDSDKGRSVSSFLYHALEVAWSKGEAIQDFPTLASISDNPARIGIDNSASIIRKNTRKKLAQKIRHLSLGMEKLFFSYGVPLDMDMLLTPVNPGKTPVNVIYLNTLTSEEHKQFYVAVIGNELYNWMLTNPSDEVQALFYIDEVGPYLPPHPYKPPAKEVLKLLFKQGRKYGVSCMMCTQNPSDVDYKAMAQANTWALGRMMTQQDRSKVADMLKAFGSAEAGEIQDRLPILKAGEFVILSPDVFESAQQTQVRWLVTRHTTLEEESITDAIAPDVRKYFDKRTIKITKMTKGKECKAEKTDEDTKGGEVDGKPGEEKGVTGVEKPEKTPECPGCGKRLKKGAKFCTNCGKRFGAKKKKGVECPDCGKRLRKGAKFCTGCGKSFVEKKRTAKCPDCGKELKADAKFCNGCGAKIGEEKKKRKKKKKFCTSCGDELKANAKFCTSCGKKF